MSSGITSGGRRARSDSHVPIKGRPCGHGTPETALTLDEALAVARVLDRWPPGLGFVIGRDPARPRGWRVATPIDGEWRQFKPWEVPPAASDDVKHCPVVTVHVRRGVSERSTLRYDEHHNVFWTLIEALVELWVCSPETAREEYNEGLRTDPRRIADAFRDYAALIECRQG